MNYYISSLVHYDCTYPILQILFQKHPFITFYNDGNDEVISTYVRRYQEQQRIMNASKRFPSDLSLSSTSSGWSGMSGQSSSKVVGHVSFAHGPSGPLSSGHLSYPHGDHSHGVSGHSLYAHGLSEDFNAYSHPPYTHGLSGELNNSGGTFHMDTS